MSQGHGITPRVCVYHNENIPWFHSGEHCQVGSPFVVVLGYIMQISWWLCCQPPKKTGGNKKIPYRKIVSQLKYSGNQFPSHDQPKLEFSISIKTIGLLWCTAFSLFFFLSVNAFSLLVFMFSAKFQILLSSLTRIISKLPCPVKNRVTGAFMSIILLSSSRSEQQYYKTHKIC